MISFIKTTFCIKNISTDYSIKIVHRLNDIGDAAEIINNTENGLMQSMYLQGLETAFAHNVKPVYIYLEHKQTKQKLIWYGQLYNFDYKHFAQLKKSASQSIWKAAFLKSNCLVTNKVLVLGNLLYSGQMQYIDAAILDNIKAYLQTTFRYNVLIVKDAADTSISTTNQFHTFALQPNMVLQMQPTWHTIQDYVQALQPKYKKRWNNTFNHNRDVEIKNLSLAEVALYQKEIYALYLSVFEKSETTYNKISPNYFYTLKNNLQENYQLFGCFLDNVLIGFGSFICSNNKMITEFIGYNANYNKTHKVYQTILYKFIELACINKNTQIEFGRTGMEIKSTLGAQPVYYNTYIQFANACFHKYAKQITQSIKEEDWQPRNPFK